jgi:putative exporter of polyketide antibiotics
MLIGKLLDYTSFISLLISISSIPHLLSMTQEEKRGVANVMLSADETYADIMPVRLDPSSVSAFISIMR